MTLHQLFRSNRWPTIEKTLIRLYPDQDRLLKAYRNVFEKLQITEPVPSETEITLTNLDENADTGLEAEVAMEMEVSGRHKLSDVGESVNTFALEFTPWNEWLGMTISPAAIMRYSEPEIIAHCLHEMTYISFDEHVIATQLKNMTTLVNAMRNSSEAGGRVKNITLSEFLNQPDHEQDT